MPSILTRLTSRRNGAGSLVGHRLALRVRAGLVNEPATSTVAESLSIDVTPVAKTLRGAVERRPWRRVCSAAATLFSKDDGELGRDHLLDPLAVLRHLALGVEQVGAVGVEPEHELLGLAPSPPRGRPATSSALAATADEQPRPSGARRRRAATTRRSTPSSTSAERSRCGPVAVRGRGSLPLVTRCVSSGAGGTATSTTPLPGWRGPRCPGRAQAPGLSLATPGQLAGGRVVRRDHRRPVAPGRPAGRSARRGRCDCDGGLGAAGVRRPSACCRRPAGERRVGALVAGVADRRVLGEDQAEVGVVQAGVRALRHDGEAARDDVGVDAPGSAGCPSRCLTTTSPVVTRLLISSPRSTLFCSRNVRSSLAVAEPLSISVRRSRVVVGQRAGEQRQVPGEAADRRALSTWPSQHRVAVADQGRGDVEVVRWRSSMNELPVSMIRARSCPVPLNAAPELVDDGAQVVLSTDSTVSSRSVSSSVGRDRDRGVVRRDLRAVLEVGPVVGLRLQLDVLLADRRPVADQRQRVGRDRVVALVDVEVRRRRPRR